MKQLNNAIITKSSQDREPTGIFPEICILCDSNHDRCSYCDAIDWKDQDCGKCDSDHDFS